MITSSQNPIIKQFKSLENSRARRKTGFTALEGFRTLRHAYNNGWQIHNVLYVPERMKEEDWVLVTRCREKGAYVDEISNSLLEKLSRREGPLGVLAIIKWEDRYTLGSLPLSDNPLILIAEAIEKPGNLGVLIRSASAAGADAVILCDPLTAFHEPSCIHSSLGSVFNTPIVTTSTTECLKFLKDRNIAPVVTTPDAEISYTDFDFNTPSAIIMGNEHSGASKLLLDSGIKVKITMRGPMDSLNVSVAGAIFLFEAVRQRHSK